MRMAHGATERFLDGVVDDQGPLPADDRPGASSQEAPARPARSAPL